MSRPLSRALAALVAVLLALPLAHAQDDARQQAAESSFDAIMQQNEKPAKLEALGYVDAGAPAAAAPAGAVAPDGTTPGDTTPGGAGTVDVPLARYEGVREQIAAARAAAARSYATLVVLGASTYTGKAVPGGLELHLQLQATLRGPGFWKAVPLVGEEVAVVRARVGSAPIALTNQNGYQVWVTDRVGEVTLDLDLLVPARGPRGSLEYDFLVARTPVTRFDCSFPDAGLEPRLRRAVRADVTAEVVGGKPGTRLSAWLEPTSRVHLVGFKDLGDEDGRAAKVYVETLSLLSVEESTADLFTVFRYDILQAGTNRFDILVPPGLTVVSADGAGAFRYTLEPGPDGTLLRGETAFPIRDAYEVSLRLSRTLDGAALDVVPPRAVGVEREHGWLGVEVLGTIQLQEVGRADALAVDVAQLPAELVGNAVSPVLQGWRYHSAGAKVALTATRLPEREPAAGSVDEVVARTRIAPEGRASTELSITLRNRLRHSLRLRLPEGVVVRASRLDDEPVKPSRAADGSLLLPLKRSAGERPEPFTLHLTLEGDVGALGLVGLPTLTLPAIELPVSSLRWDVQVPAANRYTRLYGDVAPQADGAPEVDDAEGRRLRHTRYWIGADQPVTVRFGYLRGWLRAPLALLGAVALAWSVGAARRRWAWLGAGARVRLVGALGLGVGALGWFGGVPAVLLAGVVAVGAALAGVGRARLAAAWAAWRRPVEDPPVPGSWRAGGWAWRAVLLAGTGFVGLLLLIGGVRLMVVLANPLG